MNDEEKTKDCATCASLEEKVEELEAKVQQLRVENKQLNNYIEQAASDPDMQMQVLDDLRDRVLTMMRQKYLVAGQQSRD